MELLSAIFSDLPKAIRYGLLLAKRFVLAILLIYFLVLALDSFKVGIEDAFGNISLEKLKHLILLGIVPGVVIVTIPVVIVTSIRIFRIFRYCRRRQVSIFRLTDLDLNEVREMCK